MRVEIIEGKGAVFGANVYGVSHCNQSGLRCVVVRNCANWAKCSLGGEWGRPRDGCIRWGQHSPRESGGLNGIFECIVKQECIRLVHENFIIFLFGKYECISGNVVYSSFSRCPSLRYRSRHLRKICKNITVTWIFSFASGKLSSIKLLWGVTTRLFPNGFGEDLFTLRFQLCVLVLSHWPHVATHVATQVAQLVASVKGLGHKLFTLRFQLCV